MVDQSPRPPCAAYRVIENLLHPNYFTQPPVDNGIELTVTHRSDGRPTRWIFAHEAADAIEIRLRKVRGVTVKRAPWLRVG